MTEQRDISRESCPEKPSLSHHLKPQRTGRHGFIQACTYCGKTSVEIRAAAPTPEVDLSYSMTGRPAPTKIRNFNRKRG